MAKKYYLGMDQGTTGTTTLLLDEKWNLVARGYKEHSQIYPNPGWVEHDAEEIWQKVKNCMISGNLQPSGMQSGRSTVQ